MPLPWKQVAEKEEFKALSIPDQAKARVAYFEDVIKPSLPPDDDATMKAVRADFIRHTKDVDLEVNTPWYYSNIVKTPLLAIGKAVGAGLGAVNSPLAFVWGSQTARYIDPEGFDTLPFWQQSLVAVGGGLESAWRSATKEGAWGDLYGEYHKAVTGKTISEALPSNLKWAAPTIEFAVNIVSDPLIGLGAAKNLSRFKVPKEFIGSMPEKVLNDLAKINRLEVTEKAAVQNKLVDALKNRQSYMQWWEDRLGQFDLRHRGEPLLKGERDPFSNMTAPRQAKVGQPKREFADIIPRTEAGLSREIRTTPKIGKPGITPEAIGAMERMNAYRESKGLPPLKKFNKEAYDKFVNEQNLEKVNSFRSKKGLPPILKNEEGFIDLANIGEAGEAAWKHFKEFWMPWSTVPEGKAALFQRYKAMGKVGQATKIAKNMFTRLDKFPLNDRQDVFRFLDGQMPLRSLSPDVRKTAKDIQEVTKTVGKMLVKRGIINQKTFDSLKGKYVHYMYAKYALGDDAMIKIGPTGKLDLSYAKARKNLSPDEQAALGLIEDAQIAVPTGMGKALTDIAKFDYLDTISRNPDWAWQPSFVDVPLRAGQKPTRMSIGKLSDELKIYEKMVEETPNAEIIQRRDILRSSLNQAMEQTGNVPKDFVQLPTTKTYGPLAGAFVRKPIADDLKPIMSWSDDLPKMYRTLVEIEQKGMALFKVGKVAVNLPTATRNVVSNIIQNNMRGRNLPAIVTKDIPNALKSMLNKDQWHHEFEKLGGFKTNWSVTEINEILDEFAKAKTGTIGEVIDIAKRVAKYYGRIDDISKLSIYRQLRTSGAPKDKAILEAMKWGMDYSLASRSVKHLRRHIMPFLSYAYKVSPLIAESLAKRPWVIAKYAMIPTMSAGIVKEMHDMSEGDWGKLLKQLPLYIKKSGSYMIMPMKSEKGNWRWVNTEYFFPWGNHLAVFKDMAEGEIGEIVRDMGIGNPALDIYRMVASARQGNPPEHPYTGRPIWNLTDAPSMKAAKLIEAIGNEFMPSMLTRYGAAGTTVKAIKGEKDVWGREVTPAQAALKWFGVNILEPTRKQTTIQIRKRVNDIKKEMFRIRKDPTMSLENKKEHRKRAREMIKELQRKGF